MSYFIWLEIFMIEERLLYKYVLLQVYVIAKLFEV